MAKTITLRGEELACVEDGISLDLLFDVAEAFADEENVIRAAGILKQVIYAAVLPEDHARLKAVLAQMKLKDIEELNQVVGGLLAVETGRPTERPSDSPTGSTPTGGPSRVVSLSRGTVQEAPRSSRAGASRAS